MCFKVGSGEPPAPQRRSSILADDKTGIEGRVTHFIRDRIGSAILSIATTSVPSARAYDPKSPLQKRWESARAV